MKWVFKYYVIIFYGYILKIVFSFFPLKKNFILFTSFDGEKIACNPLYIYKYLGTISHNFSCYWVVTEKVDSISVVTKNTVFRGSLKYYYLMHTAKFIITNDRIAPFFTFRKKQVIINTWHGGGAFKRTFGHPEGLFKWYIEKTNRRDAKRTSYFISSSAMWTEVIARKSFGFVGEVLPYGYPRNDVLLENNVDLIKKVKNDLSIDENFFIVLYAPTYRPYKEKEFEHLDIDRIKATLESLKGRKCVFLYRGHHLMKEEGKGDFINVSHYPDMQELLLISDMLISDYSSCMWDFSLTYRPCFIYAPDFNKYFKEPGFESDYHEWPFIIANNNDVLNRDIVDFDEKVYFEKVKKYHSNYGSYEKGDAAMKIYKKLQELSLK